MNKWVSPTLITRVRLVNGVVFAALGVFILVQTARAAGADWRGISGYVLAAALIGLGVTRFVVQFRQR